MGSGAKHSRRMIANLSCVSKQDDVVLDKFAQELDLLFDCKATSFLRWSVESLDETRYKT